MINTRTKVGETMRNNVVKLALIALSLAAIPAAVPAANQPGKEAEHQ